MRHCPECGVCAERLDGCYRDRPSQERVRFVCVCCGNETWRGGADADDLADQRADREHAARMGVNK